MFMCLHVMCLQVSALIQGFIADQPLRIVYTRVESQTTKHHFVYTLTANSCRVKALAHQIQKQLNIQEMYLNTWCSTSFVLVFSKIVIWWGFFKAKFTAEVLHDSKVIGLVRNTKQFESTSYNLFDKTGTSVGQGG